MNQRYRTLIGALAAAVVAVACAPTDADTATKVKANLAADPSVKTASIDVGAKEDRHPDRDRRHGGHQEQAVAVARKTEGSAKSSTNSWSSSRAPVRAWPRNDGRGNEGTQGSAQGRKATVTGRPAFEKEAHEHSYATSIASGRIGAPVVTSAPLAHRAVSVLGQFRAERFAEARPGLPDLCRGLRSLRQELRAGGRHARMRRRVPELRQELRSVT